MNSMSSSNKITYLKFKAWKNYMIIVISYCERFETCESFEGCVWEFKLDDGKRYMKYKKKNVTCEKKFEDSTDWHMYAARLCTQLLERYKETIEVLDFQGTVFNGKLYNYDFGIEKLSTLRELYLYDEINAFPIVSKLRITLRILHVHGAEGDQIIENCPQIYQVTEKLNLISTKLTNSQMLRLSAEKVDLPLGDLTELEVSNFIKAWQNQTLGKEIANYSWDRKRNTKFDGEKLFNLLGAKYNDNGRQEFEAKLMSTDGKRASLFCEPCAVTFIVWSEDEL